MVTFALLIMYHPQVAEWRCAFKAYGEVCVMTSGMKTILQLLADSWDLTILVQFTFKVTGGMQDIVTGVEYMK